MYKHILVHQQHIIIVKIFQIQKSKNYSKLKNYKIIIRKYKKKNIKAVWKPRKISILYLIK